MPSNSVDNPESEHLRKAAFAAPAGSADSQMSLAYIRIYTRCPACHNDTLTINKGRLLCTWHVCPDPTLIDRIGELNPPNEKLTDSSGR